MLLKINSHLDKNYIVIDNLINLETGELFANLAEFFKALPLQNTAFFIPDFTHYSIYFLNWLLENNFNCTCDYELKTKQFNIRASGNSIGRINFNYKNKKYALIDYLDKFGQEFDGTLDLYNYAQNHNFNQHTLARDAFELFIKKRYGRGDARYEKFREDYPILPIEIQQICENIKENYCKGYQFAKKANYSELYEMDQFSAYPAQLFGDTPKGLPYIFNNLEDVPEKYFKIIEFVYSNLTLKDNFIDFLSFDLGKYNTFGHFIVPECYFNLLKAHYNFNLKIIKIYAFKTEKNRFKSLVNELVILGRKNQPKKIAKYNKGLAVALVGKFGQKTHAITTYIKDNEICSQMTDFEPIYTPLHIAVVCAQKCLLIKMHQKFKNDTVYANTDSLLTTRIIDNINDLLPNLIEDLGHFRPKSMLKRVGICGINKYYAIDDKNNVKTCLSGVKFERTPTIDDLENNNLERVQYICDFKKYKTYVLFEKVKI